MKLKIALLEPYTLALQGICDTISNIPDLEIVGAYVEEKELLTLLNKQAVDVIILDLMLKSSQGFDTIEAVRNVNQDAKLIVLTEVHKEVNFRRGIEMGVNAFLGRDTSYSELISAIANVGKGKDIFPSALVKETNNALLSEMELKVLRLLANEQTNAEIAKELYISARTVDTHVNNIYRKLEVGGRIGAVREAIRLKLV